MAVAAPATRAPTTTTSYEDESLVNMSSRLGFPRRGGHPRQDAIPRAARRCDYAATMGSRPRQRESAGGEQARHRSGSCGTAAHAQLGVAVLQVSLHGAHAEVQAGADLLVGQTVGGVLEDLAL